jgi:hypothetical protein
MAGYELRPVAIDRHAGRWPLALTAMVGLVASMLIVKPWSAVVGSFVGPPVAPLRLAAGAPPAVAPPGAGAAAAPRTAEAPNGLGSLARHSGSWGVGAAGLDAQDGRNSWAAWTAVSPAPASSVAGLPASPSSGLCDRVPTLPANALFIAVSNAADVPADRTIGAWWWEHGTATPLEGEIHQVTPAGDRGIDYVVRNDGGAWLAGRYVFRLSAGDRAVDLAVCVAATP